MKKNFYNSQGLAGLVSSGTDAWVKSGYILNNVTTYTVSVLSSTGYVKMANGLVALSDKVYCRLGM